MFPIDYFAPRYWPSGYFAEVGLTPILVVSTRAAAFDGASRTAALHSALATVRAWYSLATTGLTPAFYSAVFSITALGSDSLTRIFKPSIAVEITPAAGRFSYNEADLVAGTGSAAGRLATTRLLLTDT